MEVVAQVNHDFNGDFELFSYEAKPAENLGQAEAIAQNQYGELLSKVKSPLTMFTCLWRNTSYEKLESDQPAEIFLSCSFAPNPVLSSGSLVKDAEMFNTIDRVNLKAVWDFKTQNYHLSRFELEILADGKMFRSANLGADDMSQIRVEEIEMKFPKTVDETLKFNLQSKLPFRQNKGKPQSDPVVSISLSGIAEPIPDWINY